MITVRHNFLKQKEEIDLFFNFLDEIINHDARLIIDPPANTIKTIKVETIAVMKSSFFLMLYNCVESTVVNCLRAILRVIEGDGCKYNDLIDELQIASLAAYDYNVKKCESKDEKNKSLKQQIDFQTGLSVFHLDLRSLMSSSSQGNFSGSLDAKEIRKIFSLLALDLSTMRCDELVQVKNCRNKLAHGEVSFEDYGRNYSIQYLQVSKDHTLTYLNDLISNVDKYLTFKDYRR